MQKQTNKQKTSTKTKKKIFVARIKVILIALLSGK